MHLKEISYYCNQKEIVLNTDALEGGKNKKIKAKRYLLSIHAPFNFCLARRLKQLSQTATFACES